MTREVDDHAARDDGQGGPVARAESREEAPTVSITMRPEPGPMLPWSTTTSTMRPPPCPALVLNGKTLASDESGAPGAVSCEMNCTDARRRGLPSTVREKLPASRPRTGLPVESTTLTSTATRSTPVRNVGGACCGGVCAAGA